MHTAVAGEGGRIEHINLSAGRCGRSACPVAEASPLFSVRERTRPIYRTLFRRGDADCPEQDIGEREIASCIDDVR